MYFSNQNEIKLEISSRKEMTMTLQKVMHVKLNSTLSNKQSKRNHKKNYKTFREIKAQNIISLDAVKAAPKRKIYRYTPLTNKKTFKSTT